MILALPKSFFENWEWRAGDRAITSDGREVMVIDSPSTLRARGNGAVKVIYPYSVYDEYDMFNKNSLRCKFTQKQLQEISGIKGLVFLARFNDFLEKPVKDDEDIIQDMDCFTLSFIMDLKCGKYWNGKYWIAENQ
jgi:hypothetical protein